MKNKHKKKLKIRPIHFVIAYIMFIAINIYFGKLEYRNNSGEVIGYSKNVHEMVLEKILGSENKLISEENELLVASK